ncbi:MAG TPA: prolipoprotein diacylglyceryl transferase [Steroidobacteraceae bacterium]|jgi:phosphatidylglycerol:prolipoprotein diacylglycerol transferase|nr:prolipoprotein diacylglyceryl transferase [Steroidobacteraceae bacterium]
MIAYPEIDPVAFAIGPVRVHWYGLMYVVGFAAGWWLARRRAALPGSTWKPADVDDLIFFAAMGVILGGRIGWILVYGFDTVLENPWNVFRVWEGGMSFHGGLIGVMLAVALFAKRRGRRVADVFDFTAPLPAVGLFAGRLGNFINGELWGKPTDLPWGVLYRGEVLHPSQLYEAALEGLVMFAILWWFTMKPRWRLAPAGLFLALYGLFRFLVEFVRVPDANLGYLAFGWLTMGQVLSLPVLAAGLAMLGFAYTRRQPSGNYA